ncbi:Flavo-diiron protein FprA1 [bioreactor metagenome]|uniref:Flavo-diiron protein FprA1 n=1 Tax=bioreactor metagenome TaxID=1076179 RepID=A0A644XBK6_9ZZZZ
MNTLELKKGFYWTGMHDPDLRVFDITMYTEFGTTYNSYLLKGSEKTALFESNKAKFLPEYLEKLQSLTDLSQLDYLVVDHTEPDHAGCVEALLSLCPKLKIVGTPAALNFLQQIVNRNFPNISVKENDTLSLGDKTLRFMALPNLHWPDTMFTYVEEDKTLITCDSFGAHYSHPGILRSTVTDIEGYNRATKYYFDNILGPFKRPYMSNALERIKDLPFDMICTGHGPVLDSHIDEILDSYRAWCATPAPRERKVVVMPYVSAYGYTKALAQEITRGLNDKGIDVHSFDMVETDPVLVTGELAEADAFLFGSPTIVGDALPPIWNLLSSMHAATHGGKPASAFGSYGWSGEAVPHLTERLRQLKLNVMDGYRVRLKPNAQELAGAYSFGQNFGKLMLGEKEDSPASAPVSSEKKVRCDVCGAIFAEGPDKCPVCGADPTHFKPLN